MYLTTKIAIIATFHKIQLKTMNTILSHILHQIELNRAHYALFLDS